MSFFQSETMDKSHLLELNLYPLALSNQWPSSKVTFLTEVVGVG